MKLQYNFENLLNGANAPHQVSRIYDKFRFMMRTLVRKKFDCQDTFCDCLGNQVIWDKSDYKIVGRLTMDVS